MQDDSLPTDPKVPRHIATDAAPSATDTIQLAAEALRVGKMERVTGRVHIGIATETVAEPVSLDLSRTEMRVDRIEVGRMLEPDELPPVQSMQGDTTVIPILEEIIVVEKRLILRAELHVTPVTSTEAVSTTVELRRQVATIDRLPADPMVPADAETSR